MRPNVAFSTKPSSWNIDNRLSPAMDTQGGALPSAASVQKPAPSQARIVCQAVVLSNESCLENLGDGFRWPRRPIYTD